MTKPATSTLTRRSALGLLTAAASVGTLAACSATAASSSTHIRGTKVITEVFGDGQKVAAIAVLYDAKIAASSLSTSTFTVKDHTVTGVYTNDRAALTSRNVAGQYVIVAVSTAKINAEYTLQDSGSSSSSSSSSGGPGGSDGPGGSGGPSGTLPSGQPSGMASGGPSNSSGSGGPSGSLGSTTRSNQLEVTITQTGTVKTSSGTSYAAAAAITTSYKNNLNLGVNLFTQASYKNATTSDTLMYNLFTPAVESGSKYPMVVFMPDATATGSDPVATLTQGLGAVVWAEAASQKTNPCFVLAPQYTGSEKDDKADTVALIKDLAAKHPIDTDRIYLTGQSAGTIRAIAMLIDQPDMYGGAMLVAGQADSGYTDKLAQLKNQNLWMICSTGDARAKPGMTAIQTAVRAAGIQVTDGTWSATLPIAQQDAKAAAMAAASTHIKFTILSDVVPSGVTDNDVTEHLNTWRVAYSIDRVRDWVFKQTKP